MIIRGNSASGKSTVARRVQREQPRDAVAVIGQDHVRREMLWAHEAPDSHTPGLIATMARYCLGVGRITVVEGIFGREWYGDMFSGLLREHSGPSLVYYLDVSLAETQRRHAGKPIADLVTDAELASWYRVHDVLGAPGEVVFGEDMSEDAMVARILADLARLRAGAEGGGQRTGSGAVTRE
ncbi:kinase [Brachybacterium phenoliresistens]|uniref:Kinase n=1 Tax=Brachybacterium phenoliresistens TaxID=396014 RepID=Z9JPZ3_9MICO|nr:kinase [Brachybacterium phenoliresistens]